MSFDKISPVKIISTVWLNNYQIIVSCEGNLIFLYQMSEGKIVCVYFHFFFYYYYCHCCFLLFGVTFIFILDLTLHKLDTFDINSKMKSWITVAVITEYLIFAGCNEGSVYLYKLNQKVHIFKIKYFILWKT